tara:strand:- start:9133 stop:10560 length:1428 start_codon:yes stop_codon:yes gene_type:complete
MGRIDKRGKWKDLEFWTVVGPPTGTHPRARADGIPYITGYNHKEKRQLRLYPYKKKIPTDEDKPNTIADINKIVSYKDNPKLWMKLYMRGSRGKGGYTAQGTRKNPKKRYPDSKFQGYGGKVKSKELKKIKNSKKEEKEDIEEITKKHKESEKDIKAVAKAIKEIAKEVAEDEEDPEILAKIKKGKGLTAKQKTILKKWRAQKGEVVKNVQKEKEDAAKEVINQYLLKKMIYKTQVLPALQEKKAAAAHAKKKAEKAAKKLEGKAKEKLIEKIKQKAKEDFEKYHAQKATIIQSKIRQKLAQKKLEEKKTEKTEKAKETLSKFIKVKKEKERLEHAGKDILEDYKDIYKDKFGHKTDKNTSNAFKHGKLSLPKLDKHRTLKSKMGGKNLEKSQLKYYYDKYDELSKEYRKDRAKLEKDNKDIPYNFRKEPYKSFEKGWRKVERTLTNYMVTTINDLIKEAPPWDKWYKPKKEPKN